MQEREKEVARRVLIEKIFMQIIVEIFLEGYRANSKRRNEIHLANERPLLLDSIFSKNETRLLLFVFFNHIERRFLSMCLCTCETVDVRLF